MQKEKRKKSVQSLTSVIFSYLWSLENIDCADMPANTRI